MTTAGTGRPACAGRPTKPARTRSALFSVQVGWCSIVVDLVAPAVVADEHGRVLVGDLGPPGDVAAAQHAVRGRRAPRRRRGRRRRGGAGRAAGGGSGRRRTSRARWRRRTPRSRAARRATSTAPGTVPPCAPPVRARRGRGDARAACCRVRWWQPDVSARALARQAEAVCGRSAEADRCDRPSRARGEAAARRSTPPAVLDTQIQASTTCAGRSTDADLDALWPPPGRADGLEPCATRRDDDLTVDEAVQANPTSSRGQPVAAQAGRPRRPRTG